MLDRVSISLSFLCVAHCLILPFAILVMPILGATFLKDEAFHLWLLFLVVPTSIFSLWLGCRKHGRMDVLMIGAFGLSLLLFIVILGADVLGNIPEKISTVTGAAIIPLAHVRNMRACKKAELKLTSY